MTRTPVRVRKISSPSKKTRRLSLLRHEKIAPPADALFKGILSFGTRPHHAVSPLEYAVKMRGESEYVENGGTVAVMRSHRRLCEEGIKLLHKELVLLHDAQIFPGKFCRERKIPVFFKREQGALISKALRLSAPVVFAQIAEGTIVCGNGGKREGRIKFLGIQKMLPHEPRSHIDGKRAVIHTPQIVVNECIRERARLVAVKARAPLLPP